MPDRDRQLDQEERDFAEAVAAALTETADEFADAVQDATELVAARFSVGRIARMWGNRTRGLVRRLLGTAETAAVAAAEDVDAELPAGWDDLPGRYDDDTLPEGIGQYVTTTEHLLRAVGDRLAEAARAELAAGVDAGEDIDQLRARLRAAFSREGAQLGPVREQRIARTEASRAWNSATLAAAQAATGPDRPVVKQWITRHDARVRSAHDEVDGQLRLLAEPFTVAGVEMQAPGDPTAPPGLVCNCRCRLGVAPELQAAAMESQVSPAAGLSDPRESRVEVALSVTAAVDGSHLKGAMVALLPTQEEAARLAIEGGESAEELHLTLFFLGDNGDDWTDEQRDELIGNIRAAAEGIDGPLTARAFGANHWNPDSDSPSWVWAIGDDRDRELDAPTLDAVHHAVTYAVEDTHGQPELPVQHSPWQPHVCAVYSEESWPLDVLVERLGPVTFDRIRIAFAGEHTDISLGTQEEPMAETTAAGLPARPWSTPDDCAIAFENQQTGDGRIFSAGALYWSGPGPWPLQYADEMLMGHQGAELAGAIQEIDRNGDRITSSGVLYSTRYAGQDAITLLEEEAPLGISVDLDDVDIEFVDKTLTEEDAGWLFASATLSSVSLLPMDDGAFVLSASTGGEWAASGGIPSRNRFDVQLITGPAGQVTAEGLRAAFAGTSVLTAAAGDPDDDNGLVVHSESSGDFLVRITRARLRGATLVAMPAYDRARIVLDPIEESQEPLAVAAASVAAVTSSDTHQRVVAYVSSSPVAVGAREVATAVEISMSTARGHLVRAAKAGRLMRLAPGLYVGSSTLPEGEAVASAHTEDDDSDELVASAWTAMRDTDPMPAAWFQEPTEEELPPGSGGVHYSGGRVYGWVAQAGEPHAGYPGRNLTIESLGKLDLSHFLRAHFSLDDGSTVRAGAFTMNAGHHRDGAECETSSCQFDDTRTVAGIVTVGMNERGLWFSGAAAPWLSEWDRQVFQACQPSYHMKQGGDGRWQLRAVLSVPVPGHSSPLLASTIAERSNLALAASAADALIVPDTVSGQLPDSAAEPATVTAADLPGHGPDTPSGHGPDTGTGQPAVDVERLVAALTEGRFIDVLLDAMSQREIQRRAEIDQLAASIALTPEEITASANPKGAN
ncbi:phage minor head protein [Streptomyces sp. NBC_01230]|uniref:phage minor head protein n=1 Tax=Streptomyces sp. NBC_01230 TaxID=2903784 RepID=UPI002E0E1DBE|nr:phage minor head protein [Streptomyces sp. NBC_01230]